MNLSDSERVELNDICSAVVDGAANESQRARLEDMLRSSDEARQFYVRAMQLSASLHSYAAEMQSEPVNVIRPRQWQRWLVPLAAAAAVVLGLWISGVFDRSTETGLTDDEVSVARVTGGKDCQWSGASYANGDELAAGKRLELKSGAAEITFDSGALLVIEGPASLEVHSAWEAELRSGTVKASVPEEAIGFRVTNPAVEVVDLGTEFSVTANDGEAEVFVHKGAVEVHPRDAQGKRQAKSVLKEKQARRFARAGSGEVRDGSVARWQKLAGKIAVVRLAKPYTYARWSFEEGGGKAAASTAPSSGGGAFVLDDSMKWSDGQYGLALEFDGKSSARAELSGPLKRGVRTIAFWVRIPPTASDAGAFTNFPLNRMRFDFSWNRSPADGVVGAPRLQAGAGSVVGTKALNDGKWHHVAAVLNMAPKNPARQSVKIYVDGRLENFSGKRPFHPVLEKLASDQDPSLWLGSSPSGSERFFGQIDELLIADQQLTPQEIRYLMRENALLSPEGLADL